MLLGLNSLQWNPIVALLERICLTLQVDESICKFAKKGLTPSQIGVILRDSHGIPQVKSVTGNKILRILKAHGVFFSLSFSACHLPRRIVIYLTLCKALLRRSLRIFTTLLRRLWPSVNIWRGTGRTRIPSLGLSWLRAGFTASLATTRRQRSSLLSGSSEYLSLSLSLILIPCANHILLSMSEEILQYMATFVWNCLSTIIS